MPDQDFSQPSARRYGTSTCAGNDVGSLELAIRPDDDAWVWRYGLRALREPRRLFGDGLGPRKQTLAVKLRVRSDSDLDACEHLAHEVHAADGYPPRCADDLLGFVSASGALYAWVAESEKGVVGHVALLPRSSRAVMEVGSAATGRPPEQLCVVARLFVSPTERNAGIGSSLLALAADAGLARGLRPILDVAAHLGNAIRLYERAGWMCAGQVTVDFHNEAPLRELVYIGPDPGRVGR